jgi:hypothetical protein
MEERKDGNTEIREGRREDERKDSERKDNGR